MKKLISVTLALVMIFALTFTVAAKSVPSPTGTDYYSITVEAEGKGSASTDKDKVDVKAEGDDAVVTLTATPEGGFFTLWIMNGDYETVEGDEKSLVFKIKPLSDVHAIANFSEEEDYLNIYTSVVGDGTASANPTKVKKGSGDNVTLTAVDGKDTFVEWKLACDYDIVSGDLKSRTLVIKPYTDIYATAYFQSQGATEATTAPTEKKNDSNTSPKTGDPMFLFVGLAALALAAGVVAVKKIKE